MPKGKPGTKKPIATQAAQKPTRIKKNYAEKMVTLVTTEILTPYRANEVFTVPEKIAKKILRVDMTPTDFGPRYPKVKARLFDPERDQHLLLANKVLNQEEHDKLLHKLNPEWADDEDEGEDEGDYTQSEFDAATSTTGNLSDEFLKMQGQ